MLIFLFAHFNKNFFRKLSHERGNIIGSVRNLCLCQNANAVKSYFFKQFCLLGYNDNDDRNKILKDVFPSPAAQN